MPKIKYCLSCGQKLEEISSTQSGSGHAYMVCRQCMLSFRFLDIDNPSNSLSLVQVIKDALVVHHELKPQKEEN